MNIANVFVPSDIWNLIFLRLNTIDYINLIKTCKTIKQIGNRLYLYKKLRFARSLLRCTYGPIYLIKKYNDIELLKFYLSNLGRNEPDKIDCKDNKILYDFLINYNIGVINDLDHCIYTFDDVDSYHKYKDKLNIDLNSYSFIPIKIYKSLLPVQLAQTKRRRTCYNNILSIADIVHFLCDSDHADLLDHCYQNWPETVKATISKLDISPFSLSLDVIHWLEKINLLLPGTDLSFDKDTRVKSVKSFEYLVINYNVSDINNILMYSNFGYNYLSIYPQMININLIDYCYTTNLNYLDFLLNHMDNDQIPKRIRIHHCSFDFYCFCLSKGIKIKVEIINYIEVSEFINNNITIINEAVRLLKAGCSHYLFKELYFLGYVVPSRLISFPNYNIFTLADLDRIKQALPKHKTEEIIRFLNDVNSNIVDKLLTTDIIKNLPINHTNYKSMINNKMDKILIRLGKLSRFCLHVSYDDIIKAVYWNYKMNIFSYINILENRDADKLKNFINTNNISRDDLLKLNNQISDFYCKQVLL